MFNYKKASEGLSKLVAKYAGRATRDGQLEWAHAQMMAIVNFNIQYEKDEGDISDSGVRAMVWRDVLDGFLQVGSSTLNAVSQDLFNALPPSSGEKMYNEAVQLFSGCCDAAEEEERAEEDERLVSQREKKMRALDKADEAKALTKKRGGLRVVK